MIPELIHRAAGEDYEFVCAGKVVGKLVWLEHPCADQYVPGWILQVPGWPDRQISRVPRALADDLPAARSHRASASLGVAQAIVDDRLSGLVPKPATTA